MVTQWVSTVGWVPPPPPTPVPPMLDRLTDAAAKNADNTTAREKWPRLFRSGRAKNVPHYGQISISGHDPGQVGGRKNRRFLCNDVIGSVFFFRRTLSLWEEAAEGRFFATWR